MEAMLLVLLVIDLLQTGCHSSNQVLFQQSTFSKEPICHMEERMEDGCSKELPGASLISCLAECTRDISCIGASVEKSTGKCFLQEECSPMQPCKWPDTAYDFYSRYCVHGHWDNDANNCTCRFGTFGERCDQAIQDCLKFYPAGFPEGVHTVYIDPRLDGNLVKVRCQIYMSRYTKMFAVLNSGGMSFNRTWTEYLRGFYSDDMKNYWIGLKTWNIVSTFANCTTLGSWIRIDDSKQVYRLYRDFVVGDKTEKFKFTFSKTSSGNFGPGLPADVVHKDCLIQNTEFHTWDRDVPGKCASLAGSGWWHPADCTQPCNNVLGWGLDGWNRETRRPRFSLPDLDMAQFGEYTAHFEMYLECHL